MNIHVVSTVGILAVTLVLATLQGKQQTRLKEDRVALERDAVALGLPLDGPKAKRSLAASSAKSGGSGAGGGDGASAGENAGASDPEARAKEFAKELFAFAEKMKAMEAEGREPSKEDKMAMFAFMNRFMSLDAELIPHLMEEVRNYTELDDDAKRQIMFFAMMTMSQKDPKKALDLYLGAGELFGDDRRSDEMVAMALGGWAAKDPVAALEWLDVNEDSLGGKAAQRVRAMAIANVFDQDPSYAAGLALDLEREQLMELGGHLGRANRNPQQQLDLLRSVRDQLGDLPTDIGEIEDFAQKADKDQLLHGVLLFGLGQSLAREPFESASEFLSTSGLGATETVGVAMGISENIHQLQEPGEWLGWIHENSPESHREKSVGSIVETWTRRDHRATATWINGQEQGPLREQATLSFANAVADHEPESAAQWAATLPPSGEREALVQKIHSQWQQEDPEAAAEFAREQGLPADEVINVETVIEEIDLNNVDSVLEAVPQP